MIWLSIGNAKKKDKSISIKAYAFLLFLNIIIDKIILYSNEERSKKYGKRKETDEY